MVQPQRTEKLHAACDECRTRKLKCSGDTPRCVRCKREKIDCVYSPRKQMGRPPKRRREGEADEHFDVPAESQIEHINAIDEPAFVSGFQDFGFISPPDLPELDHSSNSTENGIVTPLRHGHGFAHTFDVDSIPIMDYSLDPPIDPSLWDLHPMDAQPIPNDPYSSNQSNTGPCTCLSKTYLTLTDLQSVQSFAFPQIIIPLRQAMSNLSDLIHCPTCPKDPFNAIQNIQSVVSLFKAIVERFNKVLFEVDAEAERLEAAGQKKPYRIGDNNPALYHLHTGTLDCPMGFNIELEARDWQRIVKTALKTEMNGGGSNPRPLLDLLQEAETRQQKWHNDKEFWNEERKQMFPGGRECHRDKSCQALGADHIRQAIDNLKWQ